MSTQTFGIRTGLAFVKNSEAAEDWGFVTAVTFDGEGRATLTRVELTADEARRLRDALSKVLA